MSAEPRTARHRYILSAATRSEPCDGYGATTLARLRYKLVNDGHDTRALQHYLGHKNIQHTVRYTEMAPGRFKGFWKD
jgi:integrase